MAAGAAAEVARHLQLAGRPDRAADHLVRAATHARTLGALEEAVAFLREALSIRGEDGELLVELAEVEAWRLRASRVRSTWARALELLPPMARARRDAWLRSAYWNRGTLCRPHEVLDSARRAVERSTTRGARGCGDSRPDALAIRRVGRSDHRRPR